MVSDGDFIFHIYIPWGKTLSLLAKSRSSVKIKVKYQGHEKMAICMGISLSETQLGFFFISFDLTLSQTTNLRLLQTERLSRQQF